MTNFSAPSVNNLNDQAGDPPAALADQTYDRDAAKRSEGLIDLSWVRALLKAQRNSDRRIEKLYGPTDTTSGTDAYGRGRSGPALARGWHTAHNLSESDRAAVEGLDLMANDAGASRGIDFPVDDEDEDQDTDDFLKAIDSDMAGDSNEAGKHFAACGLHLCKAKLAHLGGDHEEVFKSLNRAMGSYGKCREAMKSAMAED